MINKELYRSFQRIAGKAYVLFICCFILFSYHGLSQNVVFTASLNKNQVAFNDKFKLTFTIQNGNPKNFQPPHFKYFHVLSGPNAVQEDLNINGHRTKYKSFTYYLQPKAVGKFSIDGARVTINGQVIVSNKVSIHVVPATKKTKETSNIDKNVFLRAVVDKKSVYQGEQIIVTYKIYTRLNISNYQVNKMPTNSGFWSHNIKEFNQLHQQSEVIDGVEYRVGILKKEALFPQKSGTLYIEPIEMSVTITVQDKSRSRNIFDNFSIFGGYRNINRVLTSKKVKINVKELPEANKPANYNGAVGSFSFDVTLDKEQTKANDPITVKTTISGKGNIKLISKPEVEFPPNFEVYDPKIAEKISSKGSEIKGSKTFEYLAIPRLPGEYKLPGISFSYFDIDKKKYITLTSPDYFIEVSKGDGITNAPASSGITKEEIALLGEDIRFIKIGDVQLMKKEKAFYGSMVFFILLGMPFILFIFLITYLKRYKKLQSNVALLKTRRANKIARKRMVVAKKLLKQNNYKEFYDEIAKAIWGYLGDKLNIQAAELSKDKAEEVFKTRNIDGELVKQVLETLDTCEMALFSPSAREGGMDKTYHDAIRLIANLENTIR